MAKITKKKKKLEAKTTSYIKHICISIAIIIVNIIIIRFIILFDNHNIYFNEIILKKEKYFISFQIKTKIKKK